MGVYVKLIYNKNDVFKTEMSSYVIVTPKKISKISIKDEDGLYQQAWNEAKLGSAWNTTWHALIAILRNAKGQRGKWKFPRDMALPESLGDLVKLIKEELDTHEKIHGWEWVSTTTVVMNKEMASSGNWPKELKYPSVKSMDVVFNLAGCIGSPETRQIINDKVLPELGLGEYTLRTFPVFEKWNDKKHWDEKSDNWGFLMRDTGKGMKRVPKKAQDHNDSDKMVSQWDISLVKKEMSSDSD